MKVEVQVYNNYKEGINSHQCAVLTEIKIKIETRRDKQQEVSRYMFGVDNSRFRLFLCVCGCVVDCSYCCLCLLLSVPMSLLLLLLLLLLVVLAVMPVFTFVSFVVGCLSFLLSIKLVAVVIFHLLFMRALWLGKNSYTHKH